MSTGRLERILTDRQKSRRGRGELPYPITYSNDIANDLYVLLVDLLLLGSNWDRSDIWDHMFRVSYCKNLTMHEFVEPPELTLDLGCGSGFWAMEAAKQWQVCTPFTILLPHCDIPFFLDFNHYRLWYSRNSTMFKHSRALQVTFSSNKLGPW